MSNRRTVARFWELMASNDFHAVATVLHPAFELSWPQSGERVVGAFNFAEVNRNYPANGRWTFSVERMLAEGERAVTVTRISDGAITAEAISFFELEDGLIRRLTEYWPEPFAPAAWRRQWVEVG